MSSISVKSTAIYVRNRHECPLMQPRCNFFDMRGEGVDCPDNRRSSLCEAANAFDGHSCDTGGCKSDDLGNGLRCLARTGSGTTAQHRLFGVHVGGGSGCAISGDSLGFGLFAMDSEF